METTALGAAYLAGLKAGVFAGLDELKALWVRESIFTPTIDANIKETALAGWQKAVSQTFIVI